ncbi:MAG: hypothetical protein P4L92_05195 [Rudaea sp.]|nr:hypothetical protein [Rudaea sp.]
MSEATTTLVGKPGQSSVLLNVLPHILDTLKREPALAITFCYLLVAMAGIFYNYSFYAKFGIPALSLSQIGDFLVAGIQQPMAIVLVVSTFPLCWLIDKINATFRRRRIMQRDRLRSLPRLTWLQRIRLFLLNLRIDHSWYMGLVYAVAIVGYGWMFVGTYATHRASAVKRGDAAQVNVWLNGDAAGLQAKSGTAWTYLGAVANYVFVYDPADRRAVMLPVNAIARIEPARMSPGAVSPIPVAPIH